MVQFWPYLTHELCRVCYLRQETGDFLHVAVILQLCIIQWHSAAVDRHPHMSCWKIFSRKHVDYTQERPEDFLMLQLSSSFCV